MIDAFRGFNRVSTLAVMPDVAVNPLASQPDAYREVAMQIGAREHTLGIYNDGVAAPDDMTVLSGLRPQRTFEGYRHHGTTSRFRIGLNRQNSSCSSSTSA